MPKETAPQDTRLVEGRNILRPSRRRAAPLWMGFKPLRNKEISREERIILREELRHLGPEWKHEIDEHIRASKLISKAKLEFEMNVTQRGVEKRARDYMMQDVKDASGTNKDGQIFARRLISLTKSIQRQEGVTDHPLERGTSRKKGIEGTVLYMGKNLA